jgi:two-component system, sensor histidine kinase and response regulator
LSRRLKQQGHKVEQAENGRLAMEALRARPFDVVLLDIMMPEMDGYAVLQAIKNDPVLRDVAVIMISAVGDIESVVRCIELGAEDYLPKPFDATLLKARVGSCLEKKRAHDREVSLFCKLQESYKRLQVLEGSRDDLTNMIVHDLRTPLTSVIAGMQSLKGSDGLDDFQCEMVEIALSGGETLLGMISDLLDVEKMESGTMQVDYSLLRVAALVDGAVAQIAALCEAKSLTLVRRIPDDLPAFRGDELKLRRVLVNLLGNSIKFTPEGGTLTVDVRLADPVGERVGAAPALAFSVSDTGEGIPAEAFDRIFEKFGQVEARRAGRTMSTGLGLTFCKLATKAHGGNIGVRSVPGEGSTFSFTIPIQEQV